MGKAEKMVELLALAIPLAAGVGLGIFYFGGLWLTLQRLPSTRRPELLVLGSFVVRTLLAVAGFFLVFGGHWQHLVAAMVGFLIARTLLVRRWRPGYEPEGSARVPAPSGAGQPSPKTVDRR
jgi:F1F0 ATPase subunit 2